MFDVVVIGGGPAGVTAALRARELGASVALVERGNLGGTCTNDGCVPTRVLAHAARLVRDAEQFADYGLEGEPPTVDFARLLNRTQHIVYEVQEKKQLLARLEAAGVEAFERAGEARFLDANTLAVGDERNGERLHSGKFILCAGGHARRLPFPGAQHALTHSDVWTMERLPRSVAVIGGAATGCRIASVLAAFGSEARLLEVAPRILGAEDEVVSGVVRDAFGRRAAERFGRGGGDGRRVAGRRGEHEPRGGGGRGGARVRAGGRLAADERAGRVRCGRRDGADDASAERDLRGNLAAEKAVLGDEKEYRHEIVPHGGFTDPEYGSIGLTEAWASKEYDCAAMVVPYADLDRGVIDGRPEGLCKLIVDRASRRVLGAHIVGEQAVEVVQIAATAMRAGMSVEQLADVEIAYPTFTAIVGLAARRAVRDLGLLTTSPQHGPPEKTRAVEWEISDTTRA